MSQDKRPQGLDFLFLMITQWPVESKKKQDMTTRMYKDGQSQDILFGGGAKLHVTLVYIIVAQEMVGYLFLATDH